MKKYETYKDSGFTWIGSIPSHWVSKKLRYSCMITDGTHFSPAMTESGMPYITVSNVHDNIIDIEHANKISFEDYSNLVKQGCQPQIGDVLLAKDGTVGRTAIVTNNNEFVVLSSLGILHPMNDISSAFLKYSLDSIYLQEQMNAAMAGSALRRITISKINEFILLLPPMSEQLAISSYLDYKVGQIDKVIAEKEQMLEDIKTYRSSIISEAVTKGIDKNVKMKDSGIYSIGLIPSKWKVVPIKYVLEKSCNGIKIGPFGSTLTGKVSPDNEVKVYGQWNVIGKDFSAGKNFVTEETYINLESYWIHPNDILVSMMGTVGKCAIIPEGAEKGIMDSHIVKIRLDESIMLPQFFYYVYDKDGSRVIMSQIQRERRGSIMDGLNSSLIKNFVITLPPLEDQKRICKYLKKKVAQFENCLTELQLQINDLKEYKASVITEAVTGKVDLREWKNRK